MNFISLIFSIFVLRITSVVAERVQFFGYKLHRFTPQDERDVELLQSLNVNNPGVIFFRQPGNVGFPTDMMVPPHLQHISDILAEDMPMEILIEDAEALIQEHEEQHQQAVEALGSDELLGFDVFWPLADYMNFMEKTAADNNDLCTLETYGSSSEGRSLYTMTVSKGLDANNNKKPLVFIDGGNHAREWITMSTACFILNELINPSSKMHQLLDTYDFRVCPCTNPDGYVYTWTTNRLWRKTMTANAKNSLCPGVDPNRNWSCGFGKSGTSTDPCSDVYHGGSPYSIPETINLHNLIARDPVFFYGSLHSYSQLILLSYGCNELQPEYKDFDKHLAIAQKGVDAFNTDGTEYSAGKSNVILYSACGTSADSVLFEKLCKIAYTFELRDQGNYGFIAPATVIRPTGVETCDAFVAMLTEAKKTILLEEEEE